MSDSKRLAWDWFEGTVPDNVVVDETAYVETSYSFLECRSQCNPAITFGRGASTYKSTMFDLGPQAQVWIGDYALIHGARIICDREISIGSYALISWNVLIMDSYRLPVDSTERRQVLEGRSLADGYLQVDCRPIRIGSNVWIGFEACIMPGVEVGEGSVVGARSAVFEDVPPYTVVAGNPARIIRKLK